MFPKLFVTSESEGNQERAPAAEDNNAQPMPTAEPSDAERPVDVGPTKMSQATDLYRRMTRKKGTTRKEIVTAFIEEVGLTKSGAATYYQMIKKRRR